jgi:LmbE family N-acetylglucosaminyl deacetylase
MTARRLRITLVSLVAGLVFGVTVRGIGEPPADSTGHVGLALRLRKLATVGTVMLATAHPDDEHNALIARLAHGEGLRVIVATATRGSGGQNEIGPELFEALAVLRTEELLETHRWDGAEQLFGGAVDFGYSFSIDESYEKWGRDETIGDYVRLIRRTRPDAIITMRPGGTGGGQHHQASARLAAEAFDAAGDPARFPEFSMEGPPWTPELLLPIARYGFAGEPQPTDGAPTMTIETDAYDPILGATFAEVGSRARSMHKSQGFGQLLALPGSVPVTLAVAKKAGGRVASLTGARDLALDRLASRFLETVPAEIDAGLQTVVANVRDATTRLASGGPDATIDPLRSGLQAVRGLRQRLHGLPDRSRFEIDFRLAQTESKFAHALALAHGLRLEALSNDGVVTPGQTVEMALIAANRGSRALTWRQASIDGVESDTAGCTTGPLAPAAVARCEIKARIPADARVTEPYWHREGERGRYDFSPDAPFGLPFRPTPFVARMIFESEGVAFPISLPVEHRYEGNIFSGEKRMELHVVPAVTIRISPDIVIVPTDNGRAATRDMRISVTANTGDQARALVNLSLPRGWRSEPASQEVTFSRADEAVAVRFAVTPAPATPPGRYEVKATVDVGGRSFDRGFQVIEYPHTPRRHLLHPASTVIQVLGVSVPENLKVGYVMGVGDQVPQAIEQIGGHVTLLTRDDLAWGALSQFDAIVTGVRAYERRPDLRAYNHRLLEYAQQGGTVIVQYNKFEFNQAQYGPYPAKVSSARVTDEDSPVTVLDPTHPVFLRPNRITDGAWKGWAQERGLYFLGERDARYRDLLELVDPFELNAGPKRGALVEAQVGRGRWLYVGLGLWRQLPAGTEGAYHLLANLISLGRTARELPTPSREP